MHVGHVGRLVEGVRAWVTDAGELKGESVVIGNGGEGVGRMEGGGGERGEEEVGDLGALERDAQGEVEEGGHVRRDRMWERRSHGCE